MVKVRDANLDILKIIACIGVVALHTLYKSSGSLLYYLFSFSIPIFFMVSGTLLIHKEGIQFNYSLKKIFTILVLILSWNIIYTFLYYLYHKQFLNPVKLMLNNFNQKDQFAHFWFLYSLMIIYLFLPLIHKLFKSLARGILFTATLLLLMTIVDGISLINVCHGKMVLQAHITQSLRLWTWLGYFLLGGVLGSDRVRLKIKSKICVKIQVIAVIILSIFISWFQFYIGFMKLNIYLAEYHYDNIITILWVTSMYLFIRNIKIKMNATIKILSSCTMGIYIIHPLMISIFIKILEITNREYDTSYNFLLWIGITIATFIVALLMIKTPYIKKLIQI